MNRRTRDVQCRDEKVINFILRTPTVGKQVPTVVVCPCLCLCLCLDVHDVLYRGKGIRAAVALQSLMVL